MSQSWLTPEKPKQKPHGKLIGEIFFPAKSSTLDVTANKLLDKIVEIVKSHPDGLSPPSSLLLLGDTDASDSRTRDEPLARKRAQTLKDYILNALPTSKKKIIKMEAVGKRDSSMPGRKNTSPRRRVVEILNRGPALKKAKPGSKSTSSMKEALDSAIRAIKQIDSKKHIQIQRVKHWITGEGVKSLKKGRDGYFAAGNPQVKKQAQGGPELDDAEFKKLLDHNRIARELMKVGSKETPVEHVVDTLLAIDGNISNGIDFLMEEVPKRGAGGKNPGLIQMVRYILSKPKDWVPPTQVPIISDGIPHEDKTSFYWIYFQDLT